MSGPRYRYPTWQYGYTLGPAAMSGNGDYSMYHPAGYPLPPPQFMGMGMPFPRPRPPFGPRGMPFFRGGPHFRPRGPMPQRFNVPEGQEAEEAEEGEEGVQVKVEPDDAAAAAVEGPSGAASSASDKPKAKTEPAAERALTDILGGRNPIMYCNEQSKLRGLHMEWEQVSETGPPHDKTFTWSLKMGDMETSGSANSKKLAKNKAAEEMARKLDRLPRPQKRSAPFHHAHPHAHPHPHGGFFPRMPIPPNPWLRGQMKRRRMDHPMMANPMMAMGAIPDIAQQIPPAEEEPGEIPAPPPPPIISKAAQPKYLNPSQNNPISRMYEYCKQKKLPEPIFETVAENVLETKRMSQGFTLKKTEFTIQCSLMNKKFIGTAMTKKQAKYNAAAAAWAEIGAGVGQDSIESMLQNQRKVAGGIS